MSGDQDIRVLVVDDAVTYRQILGDIVTSLPGASLVAKAPNGDIAMKRLADFGADLVLLDVAMPHPDGLETLSMIRRDFPETAVAMISGETTRYATTTIKALTLGALDFIPKPATESAEESFKELTTAVSRVISLVRTRHLTRQVATRGPAAARRPRAHRGFRATRNFDVVVIGVSTGGPEALTKVIPPLPRGFSLPILVVQHMPAGFTASLATHLASRSALITYEARGGELLEAGHVVVAPGGRHLVVQPSNLLDDKLSLALEDTAPVNSCKPAVDVLLHSIVEQPGINVLAVILTGMGEDGMAGVRALHPQRAYCIAQDEATSVVYGMPRAVVESGLADEVLPLPDIAERIMKLTEGHRP